MKAEVLHLLKMLGFKDLPPMQVRQTIQYPYYFETIGSNNSIIRCNIVVEDDDDTEDIARKIIFASSQKERQEFQKELKKLIGIY